MEGLKRAGNILPSTRRRMRVLLSASCRFGTELYSMRIYVMDGFIDLISFDSTFYGVSQHFLLDC